MTKPPDTETVLSEREVQDLRDVLEQTMTAAFDAGVDQGNEVWPTIAAIRALCDSHEVLRRKLNGTAQDQAEGNSGQHAS